jgi:hypothetical protein
MYLKFHSTEGVSQTLSYFSVAKPACGQTRDLFLAFGQQQSFVRCHVIVPHTLWFQSRATVNTYLDIENHSIENHSTVRQRDA